MPARAAGELPGAGAPAAARHQLVREADDRGDWQAAGCSTSTQWLAQLSSSDYRTAQRITTTSDALRSLPALDRGHEHRRAHARPSRSRRALRDTRERCRDRAHRDRQGTQQISRQARAIVPPKVADDEELYQRRALRMTWTNGGRELAFSGQLPLEQGAAFEQAIRESPSCSARPTRGTAPSSSGSSPPRTRSSRSPATAATLTVVRGAAPPPDRAPQRRRPAACSKAQGRSAPRPPIDSPATHAASPSSPGPRPRPLARRTLRLLPATARAHKRSDGHCQYPGCTATRELEAHHLPRRTRRRTESPT